MTWTLPRLHSGCVQRALCHVRRPYVCFSQVVGECTEWHRVRMLPHRVSEHASGRVSPLPRSTRSCSTLPAATASALPVSAIAPTSISAALPGRANLVNAGDRPRLGVVKE